MTTMPDHRRLTAAARFRRMHVRLATLAIGTVFCRNIEAPPRLKRAGPTFDIETLGDTLENLRFVDLGLGADLTFGRDEHQASHKLWGTALGRTGAFQAIELE